MKKKLIIVAVAIIGLLFLGVAKDQMIRMAVTVVGTNITGAPLHMDGLSFGIFRHSIHISGLRLYNPPGFPRGVLADIPRIRVNYDLGALLRRKIHITYADFELREMVLVRNKDGRLNADSLKVSSGAEEKPSQAMPLNIDMLRLKIGRVVLKDYTVAKSPLVEVYELNIYRGYRNITSVRQLIVLILAQTMEKAGIRGALIYGISALAGVAVLPVAVGAVLISNDISKYTFNSGWDEVFETAARILKDEGTLTKEDKKAGVLEGEIDSARITATLNRAGWNRTGVTVSARKYLLPRPEIAAGIIYQISEELK